MNNCLWFVDKSKHGPCGICDTCRADEPPPNITWSSWGGFRERKQPAAVDARTRLFHLMNMGSD